MLNARNTSYARGSVRKLVMVGMLSAISIFLGVSGLGFIRLPIFQLTIMHLPVIIGAILEGPIVGMGVGLMFGLFSMYQAVTAPTVTSFIFLNPIISLLPRVLIGLVTYYVYKAIVNKLKKTNVSIGIAAVIGTLVNTVGVLGLTYVIYLERYAEAIGVSTNAVAATLFGVAVTNGVAEAIGSAILAIPVVMGVFKVQKRKN